MPKGYTTYGRKSHILLLDNKKLAFGWDANAMACDGVEIRWDGTDLDILPVSDNTVVKLGDGSHGVDFWVYGSTAANTFLFDASADKLILDNIDISLGDNDELTFGDAAGGDVDLHWDGSAFHLDGLTVTASTATASQKITIAIGSTTYYLLASE